MAYNYNHNVQRPVSAAKTLNIYSTTSEDFSLGKTASDGTINYKNVGSSTLTKEERVKYSSKVTRGLYTGIDVKVIGPERRSASLNMLNMYAQIQQIWTASDPLDDTGTSVEWDAPASASMRIKVPQDPLITTADVWELIGDLLSKFIVDNADKLPKMMRELPKLLGND